MRLSAAEDNVDPVPLIEFVSDLSELFDRLAARNHRQLHPLAISMTPSRMPGARRITHTSVGF